MVDMYVRLITETDNWTLARVPAKYRDEVKARLVAMGYDDDGNPIVA